MSPPEIAENAFQLSNLNFIFIFKISTYFFFLLETHKLTAYRNTSITLDATCSSIVDFLICAPNSQISYLRNNWLAFQWVSLFFFISQFNVHLKSHITTFCLIDSFGQFVERMLVLCGTVCARVENLCVIFVMNHFNVLLIHFLAQIVLIREQSMIVQSPNTTTVKLQLCQIIDSLKHTNREVRLISFYISIIFLFTFFLLFNILNQFVWRFLPIALVESATADRSSLTRYIFSTTTKIVCMFFFYISSIS